MRRVERFGSWSCRGNDETSNTNNNLRTHRCWLLVVLAECDGKGRNNATLRCKRMALARNCQRLLRGLDSSKTPLSNVGQVSGGGRCSIWHTWGTRWADRLLHPHQTRPKNRARYPHPLDRPVSTATCRAYFFLLQATGVAFLGVTFVAGPTRVPFFSTTSFIRLVLSFVPRHVSSGLVPVDGFLHGLNGVPCDLGAFLKIDHKGDEASPLNTSPSGRHPTVSSSSCAVSSCPGGRGWLDHLPSPLFFGGVKVDLVLFFLSPSLFCL